MKRPPTATIFPQSPRGACLRLRPMGQYLEGRRPVRSKVPIPTVGACGGLLVSTSAASVPLPSGSPRCSLPHLQEAEVTMVPLRELAQPFVFSEIPRLARTLDG